MDFVKIEGLKCPECQGDLVLKSLLVTHWPYIHGDLEVECGKCGEGYIFGVPCDRDAGLQLFIWGNNKDNLLRRARKQREPTCPFHGGTMVLTKIYGKADLGRGEKLMIQFKCRQCFLTKHFKIPE